MVRKAHPGQIDDKAVVGAGPVRETVEEGKLVAFAQQTVISQFIDDAGLWYPRNTCEPDRTSAWTSERKNSCNFSKVANCFAEAMCLLNHNKKRVETRRRETAPT